MSKRRYAETRFNGWETPSEGTTTPSATSSSSSENEDARPAPRKRVHLDNGQERRFAHMSIYHPPELSSQTFSQFGDSTHVSNRPNSSPDSAHTTGLHPHKIYFPDAVEEADDEAGTSSQSTSRRRCQRNPRSSYSRGLAPPLAEEVAGSMQADGPVGEVEEPVELKPAAEQKPHAASSATSPEDGPQVDLMDETPSREPGYFEFDKDRIWVQSLDDISDSEKEQDSGQGEFSSGPCYTVLPSVLTRLDRQRRERLARQQAGEKDPDDDRGKSLILYNRNPWPPRAPLSPSRASAQSSANSSIAGPAAFSAHVPEEKPASWQASETNMDVGIQNHDFGMDSTSPPQNANSQSRTWTPNPQFNMSIYGMAPSLPCASQQTLPQSQAWGQPPPAPPLATQPHLPPPSLPTADSTMLPATSPAHPVPPTTPAFTTASYSQLFSQDGIGPLPEAASGPVSMPTAEMAMDID